MAEITTNQTNSRRAIRLDMTPMVDLAFLLVTFFMLTTTFTKPKVMKLSMPEKTATERTTVSEELTTTLVLDKDNRLFYLRGAENPEVKITTYAPDGLRKMAYEMVKRGQQRNEDAIFLIKPTAEASYQNVVDVLDEMAIANVKVYAIQSLRPEEKARIETYKAIHNLP